MRSVNRRTHRATTRKYRQTSEAIVLDRLLSGTLKVDASRGMVYIRGRNGRWRKPYMELDRGGYLFFRLYHRGARRRVALHRAIWICVHRRLIPPQHEIHHESCNPAVNAYHRLECLHKDAHKLVHCGVDYPATWDWDEEF